MKKFLKTSLLKFREDFLLIKKDGIVSEVIKGSFLVLFASFFVLVFGLRSLPHEVPLFYSLPWGEQQLASSISLFFLILFSLAVVLLNWAGAVFVYKEQVFLARALIFLGLIISLLVSITIVKIVFLMA